MNEKRIIQELQHPLGLSEQAIIFALPGGTINKAFLLNDQDTDVLVKVFVGNDEFDIDRQDRFDLQCRLATRGLAPKPLYLSPDQTLYAEQWVHQVKSQMPLFFDETHLDQLAQSLNKIHACQLDLPALNVPKIWHDYLAQLDNDNAHLSERAEALTAQWTQTATLDKDTIRLCHNDLSWSHILGESNLILDWEYAAMGNRYFDLMSCAKINQLDDAQSAMLMMAYAKHAHLNVQKVSAMCAQQIDFVELTYDLWFELLNKSVRK